MTFPEQYKSELFEAIEQIDIGKVNQAIEWFREARDQDARSSSAATAAAPPPLRISSATW